MSAVQRVKRLLSEIEKRAAQSVGAHANQNKAKDPILAAASVDVSNVAAFKEEVTIKGSGRAIEKVLNLAAWFGDRENELGIQIRLATGTTSAIDDIELQDDLYKAERVPDLPKSRVRNISVLEAKISHK
jgi:ribonuclease P/MRP protein subunit POP7